MDSQYETSVSVTGGRTGQAKSQDGRLNVALSTPKALGGDDGDGTNPEQLFGATYGACFMGAMKVVASQRDKTLPEDMSIDATVGFGKNPDGKGFAISVDFDINLPGMDQSEAESIVESAHEVCPYSNATRNNIPVNFTVNT